MIAPEFWRATVFVSVSVFVKIAPGFLRAAVSVLEIVAGWLRAAVCVSVSEIVAGWLRAAVCVSVSVSEIVAHRLRAAVCVSVSVSEIVAHRLRAAVCVSVSVSEIVAGWLRAAVSVSVSEIVAGWLRAAVSVSVKIAPGFLRAAVCVSVFEMSARGGLAVAFDIPFVNCSHGHFSRLGREARSPFRRVSWAVGTGLAFKPGRGWLRVLTAAFASEWLAVGIGARGVWSGKFSHWFLVAVKTILDLRLIDRCWGFEVVDS